MAQVLRPVPKRRPSQIQTQASAASSQPSSRGPSSQPNSVQLPNIKECAALAQAPPAPAPSIPKTEDSTPATAATAAPASIPKTEASADQVSDTGVSTPKTEASTDQVAIDAGASPPKAEASTGQVSADAGASSPKAAASTDHVAPDITVDGASEVSQGSAEKASGLAAAPSQASTEEQVRQGDAGKPSGDKPPKDEYVSPFEQAQEAPQQGRSPFANMS